VRRRWVRSRAPQVRSADRVLFDPAPDQPFRIFGMRVLDAADRHELRDTLAEKLAGFAGQDWEQLTGDERHQFHAAVELLASTPPDDRTLTRAATAITIPHLQAALLEFAAAWERHAGNRPRIILE
jgi:hypothetical protein